MTAPDLNQAQWYCVRCQTKREHIVANHLRALDGVDVFCPRLKYRKPTSRGTIWWVESMFPGYLLARFDLQTMDRGVTFCQGVRGLVRFGADIPSIPDSFVESLRKEIHERGGSDVDTIQTAPVLQIGDEVEFAHGPLQGMSGTILSVAPAAERVKILLEFLGQPSTVDVDLFSLLLPRRPLP